MPRPHLPQWFTASQHLPDSALLFSQACPLVEALRAGSTGSLATCARSRPFTTCVQWGAWLNSHVALSAYMVRPMGQRGLGGPLIFLQESVIFWETQYVRWSVQEEDGARGQVGPVLSQCTSSPLHGTNVCLP